MSPERPLATDCLPTSSRLTGSWLLGFDPEITGWGQAINLLTYFHSSAGAAFGGMGRRR